MKPEAKKEFDPYYSSYIDRVSHENILEGLEESFTGSINFYEAIPENKWEFRYAPEKWTIKEIVQHLIDAERVFAYRALCVARKETNSLPGYDHDAYLANSYANNRTHLSLINEYKAVRLATLALFQTFSAETLLFMGVANNSPISVRALGYIIAGHEQHHISVIKERYL